MLTAAMHMLDSTYASPWPDRHRLMSHPSPPATATLHHHLRAAATSRRVAKRRPRPSRRQPTTYITADPASFRRMVHQVTGADNLPPPPPPSFSPRPELLHPVVPAPAGSAALMLPTLDTSAFLLRRRAPEPAAQTEAAAPAAVALIGAPGGNYSSSSSSSGDQNGFPTLDSWDLL
ncbi:calmodulin-binding protein 25-like [Oryza brachyantha]|nr:calmodulin-binding protein 25-like [Oryza brachyantha]